MSFLETLDFYLEKNNRTLPSLIKTKFRLYYELSKKWGSKINITANLSEKDFIRENLLDPVLAFHAVPLSSFFENHDQSLSLIDIGCGGGYVGITWAVLLAEFENFFLLDSDRKKINFCKQVIRELELKNVQAMQSRVEDFVTDNKEKFDLVLSRATWQEPVFSEKCSPLAKDNGVLIHFTGAMQVEQTPQKKIFSYTIHPDERKRHLTVTKSNP